MSKTILTLFISFLQIGLFSIGGGYAIIPLIQEQVVNSHNWLTLQEFTDIITISQMTPGPLAVNTATFVGLRISGIPGAIVATLGSILIGLIASSASTIILIAFFGSSSVDVKAVGLNITALIVFIISLFLLRKYKINPILIMILTGFIGLYFY